MVQIAVLEDMAMKTLLFYLVNEFAKTIFL